MLRNYGHSTKYSTDPGGRAVWGMGLRPPLVVIAGSNPAVARMSVSCECCEVDISAMDWSLNVVFLRVFKVCKSVHHHTFQINQPTRCNNLSSLLLNGRPDHDQQHCYHHAPTVKPDAATAVVELLSMGVRTPETCWTVHTSKR